jgi:hypothetical protein
MTQLYRVMAWFRTLHGSHLQATCKPQAGERFYAGLRSGAAVAGQKVRR